MDTPAAPTGHASQTAAEVVFRRFAPAAGLTPAADELLLVPRPEFGDTARRQLALLALDKGPAGFIAAGPAVTRVIAQADPTLDDMLAASILFAHLAQAPTPPGLRSFATYAANVREGLKAADLPLEEALEGIYLAARQQAGDLTDPAAAATFLRDWARMAQRIFEAAAAGLNPATTPLFTEDAEFTRARAYLAKDHEVYAQQDLPRGERWRVRLPEGPPSGAGLLLRKPRSVLWKYWARDDAQAPGGQGYLFLAVYEHDQHWRFSTNPVLRVPIQTLAHELQNAETKRDPARAASDPWYDGKRHSHTLVAAPHAGTALKEPEVLAVVRRWAGVQKPDARPFPWKKVVFVPAAVVLAIACAFGISKWLPSPTPSSNWNESLTRGMEVIWPKEAQAAGFKKGKDYALLIATDNYDKGWYKLNNPTRDAARLAGLLDQYGFETTLVLNPTWEQMWDALEATVKDPVTKKRKDYDNGDQLFVFIAGHGDYDAESWQGCLVARDSDRKDERKQKYLKFPELRAKIEAHPCKHVFLVLDVCYGGAIDPFANGLPWSKSRGADALSLQQLLGRMKAATRHYITSCRITETPDGAPGQHSPFAARLMEELEAGLQGKSFKTLNQLWAKVENLNPEPKRGSFHWDGLTANGSKEYSDFLFVPKGLHEPAD